MRNYLKRLFYFLMLFSVTALAIFFSIKYLFQKQNPFLFERNVNKLILGHSHIESAIDDELLSNTVSLSHSADGFFYSYVKLKEVVKYNTIDTLILAFTPTDISNNDQRWTFNPDHMASRLSMYVYFIDLAEFNDLQEKSNRWLWPVVLKSVPIDFITFLRKPTTNGLRKHFGGYDPKETTIKLTEKVDHKSTNSEEVSTMSAFDDKYFREIIALCKREKIYIVCLNPPKFNQSGKNRLINDFKHYSQNHDQGMVLIDCSGLQMPENTYADNTHLNKKGGDYFSSLVDTLGWVGLSKFCSQSLIKAQ